MDLPTPTTPPTSCLFLGSQWGRGGSAGSEWSEGQERGSGGAEEEAVDDEGGETEAADEEGQEQEDVTVYTGAVGSHRRESPRYPDPQGEGLGVVASRVYRHSRAAFHGDG